MSYSRYSGKPSKDTKQPMPESLLNVPDRPIQPDTKGQEPIRVDGFQQVLAMLRVADEEFRESLLRRIAARDQNLARSLRADLGI